MTAPPSRRKKFSVPVAVPSWCSFAAFCITIVLVGYIGPMPMPSNPSRAVKGTNDDLDVCRARKPSVAMAMIKLASR
jgi:hypothetical protein